MSLSAIVPEPNKFPIPDEDTHIARLIRIVDMGKHTDEWKGVKKVNNHLWVTFELPNSLMDKSDGTKAPLLISKQMNLSYDPKANLAKMIKACKGKDYLQPGVKPELSNLLGSVCMLEIEHKTKDDGSIKASIDKFVGAAKGTTAPDMMSNSYIFDIEEWDNNIFDTFPDWLKEVIHKSHDIRDSVDPPVLNETVAALADAEPSDSIPF